MHLYVKKMITRETCSQRALVLIITSHVYSLRLTLSEPSIAVKVGRKLVALPPGDLPLSGNSTSSDPNAVERLAVSLLLRLIRLNPMILDIDPGREEGKGVCSAKLRGSFLVALDNIPMEGAEGACETNRSPFISAPLYKGAAPSFRSRAMI